MTKLFNYLQYLVIPFTLFAIFYIARGSFFKPSLDDVGFGVLCMGIGFGFSSMGDITKTSKEEAKFFSNKRKFKRRVNALLILGIVMMITTISFVSQKQNDISVYQLGLNCIPLVIAVFFTMKQLIDKKQYYELNNQLSHNS